MSEPLIAGKDNSVETLAKRFDVMADRMRLNKDNSFGGAFVIIPPVGEGSEPIDTLILDSKQDLSQFWMLLKQKAENEIMQLTMAQRNQNAFPRR